MSSTVSCYLPLVMLLNYGWMIIKTKSIIELINQFWKIQHNSTADDIRSASVGHRGELWHHHVGVHLRGRGCVINPAGWEASHDQCASSLIHLPRLDATAIGTPDSDPIEGKPSAPSVKHITLSLCLSPTLSLSLSFYLSQSFSEADSRSSHSLPLD